MLLRIFDKYSNAVLHLALPQDTGDKQLLCSSGKPFCMRGSVIQTFRKHYNFRPVFSFSFKYLIIFKPVNAE